MGRTAVRLTPSVLAIRFIWRGLSGSVAVRHLFNILAFLVRISSSSSASRAQTRSFIAHDGLTPAIQLVDKEHPFLTLISIKHMIAPRMGRQGGAVPHIGVRSGTIVFSQADP